MSNWLTPLNQFTPRQKEVYDTINNNLFNKTKYTALIEGPPGTGKTLVLLRLALQNPNLQGICFIYTKVLVKFLNDNLLSTGELVTKSNTKIFSFYQWLWTLHRREVPLSQYQLNNSELDFQLKVQRIIEDLKERVNKVFDFILIDEGQDFSPDIISFIKRLSNKLIFTGDYNQSLYEKHEDSLNDLRNVLQYDDNFVLKDIVRVSPSRINLLKTFILQRYKHLTVRIRGTERNPIKDSKPLWYHSMGEIQFLNYFFKNVVKNYLRDGKNLAVISYHKNDVKYLYETISNLVDYSSLLKLINPNNLEDVNFTENKIYFITLLSSKGTEFDNVLYFIRGNTYYHTSDEMLIQNMAYTAYTRAIEDLVIYSPERDIPLIAKLNLNYIKEITNIEDMQEEDETDEVIL